MEEDGIEQVIKDNALVEEVEAAIKLIKLGLGELQNLDENNDFHFLPFQILSQGFERLMKCHLCYGYYNNNKKYPNYNFIKDKSHDLIKLKEAIVNEYFVTNESVLKVDKEFLVDNEDFNELLFILSEFGKQSRYHNFDIVTGKAKSSIDVKKLWGKFENKLLSANPSRSIDKLTSIEFRYQIFEEHNRYIVILFEKFVAAISRQFLFGCVGEKAQLYYTELTDFNLKQDEYGICDYRKSTTKYKGAKRKVHKRTIIDELRRRFYPNYISKKIKKSEYLGEWPFYADEIIIESRDKYWCIVTINGKDFALNRSSARRYELELPNEAGMTILGLDFSKFIKMTKEL